MGKEKAIVLSVLAMFATCGVAQAIPSAFGYDLQADMHRSENNRVEEQQNPEEYADGSGEQEVVKFVPKTAKDFYSFVPMKDLYVSTIDSNIYYENPTIRSAIARYKQGNYTGSLQELYAYIKKHPNDPYAYYCMGLAYTRLGQVTAAKNCYQKVINCNAQGRLFELALKGRDCLSGGTYCKEPVNKRFIEGYGSVGSIYCSSL